MTSGRRWLRYRGRIMTGKKNYDATKNLPAGEPTQVTEKGLKLGLPTVKQIEEALKKIAGKPSL